MLKTKQTRLIKAPLFGAAVVLTADGLAACGSSESSSESSAEGNTASCGALTIGMSAPLTGPQAYFGKLEYDAVKLAVANHNKGEDACEVKVVPYDDQGDPAQTPALMQKAATDRDVVGLVGPNTSGTAKVAGPILEEAGIPFIASAATDAALAENGWKAFHRSNASSNDEGSNDANFMVTRLKAKRVFVVNNQAAFGVSMAEPAAARLKAQGVTVATGAINPTNQDYSATVTKVKSFNADVVYCGCYLQEGAALLKQLRDSDVKAVYYGLSPFADPSFKSLAGASNVDGVYFSSATKDPAHLPNGKRFAEDWKSTYGGTPPAYSAESYDAADALLRAIRAGKHTRADINSWLDSSEFEGVSGRIKFDAKGNLFDRSTSVYLIKNGVPEFIESVGAKG